MHLENVGAPYRGTTKHLKPVPPAGGPREPSQFLFLAVSVTVPTLLENVGAPYRGAVRMRNANCELRNEKCEMRNVQCEMPNAKCEMRNAKCEMRNATCDM